MDTDDQIVPIAALQHYLYCDRQCALIHIERVWQESRHTAEGRVLHERADRFGHEIRRGVHTAMTLPLAHEVLGLTGYADVVEFGDEDWIRPIEYKRGRPKAHRADEVQICAQALCLEDMLGRTVAQGALFYGQNKRRQTVIFDDQIRQLTVDTVRATRTLISSGVTPTAVYESKKCDSCSLIDHCRPKVMTRQNRVSDWLFEQLAE